MISVEKRDCPGQRILRSVVLRNGLNVGAACRHQLLLGGDRFEHGSEAEVPALEVSVVG